MSFSFDVEKEIISRYGAVKRARGCFLYTQNGARLLDMNLDGCRAILGHGGGKARLMFKNALERGVTFSFSRVTPAPLCKALRALLPDYDRFYVFTSDESFSRAVQRAGYARSPFCRNEGYPVPRYMPWLTGNGSVLVLFAEDRTCCCISTAVSDAYHTSATETASYGEPGFVPIADAPIIEVTVPFAWKPLRILAVKRGFTKSGANSVHTALKESTAGVIKPALSHAEHINSDPLPPPLTAALTRAVYDLIAELTTKDEKDFSRFDAEIAPYWTRKGCYLFPRMTRYEYESFFLHCLDLGILISNNYAVPSVVPFLAHDSCLKTLGRTPFGVGVKCGTTKVRP